jgi:hypothetical protein
MKNLHLLLTSITGILLSTAFSIPAQQKEPTDICR